MKSKINKPLKLSFIGGGINSSIGKMHLLSSQLEKNFEIVSGFFSRNIKDNIRSQKEYIISRDRIYNNLIELVENEMNLVDFFVILTPTPNHFEVLKYLISKNVNIICEKPILSNLKEVKIIQSKLKNYKKKIYVTYNYTGYPAIREIQQIINKKKLGKLLSYNLFMTQESFLRNQSKDQKLKNWRKYDGEISNLYLDLGIHLYNLSFFLLNIKPQSVFSDNIYYKNKLSDSKIFLNYSNGTKGLFWISKSSIGNKNDLRIELFFENCSIKWSQNDLEFIYINLPNGSQKRIDRSVNSKVFNNNRYNRYRMGHPSGFLEAFSNIYQDIADDFLNKKNTYTFNEDNSFSGLKFLNYCEQSAKKKKLINNMIL